MSLQNHEQKKIISQPGVQDVAWLINQLLPCHRNKNRVTRFHTKTFKQELFIPKLVFFHLFSTHLGSRLQMSGLFIFPYCWHCLLCLVSSFTTSCVSIPILHPLPPDPLISALQLVTPAHSHHSNKTLLLLNLQQRLYQQFWDFFGRRRGGLRVGRNKLPFSSGNIHVRRWYSLSSSLGKVKMIFLPMLLRTVLPHIIASDQLAPN